MQMHPLLIWRLCRAGNEPCEQGRGDVGIGVELLHDIRHLGRFGAHQAAHQTLDAGGLLPLCDLIAKDEPRRSHGDHSSQRQGGSPAVRSGRLAHHLALGLGPAGGICQRADAQPLWERRQVAVFRLGVPER